MDIREKLSEEVKFAFLESLSSTKIYTIYFSKIIFFWKIVITH